LDVHGFSVSILKSHREVQMLRSAGSVVLGLFTLLVSSIVLVGVQDVLLLHFLPNTFPNAQVLSSSSTVMAGGIVLTILCALLAGWVTARVADKAEIKHALAVAVVEEIFTVLIIVTRAVQAPSWVWACNLTLIPLATLLGGKWRAAQSGNRAATSPA
jgi:site-specific recombinase